MTNLQALQFWAQWAPKLRSPTINDTFPSWGAAQAMWQAFVPMSKAEENRFIELFERSKELLRRLTDPLDARLSLHRQLQYSREEVYSDWLKWTLEHVGSQVGCVLKSKTLTNASRNFEVRREVPVSQGHRDQAGRLDLVISRGTDWLAVIEVKTKSYLDFDLEKHNGYRRSITPDQTDLIFIAIDEPDFDLRGFRFVSWASICIELRRLACGHLGPDQILGTALMLAFVGAVEQNLLGFSATAHSRFARNAQRDTRLSTTGFY